MADWIVLFAVAHICFALAWWMINRGKMKDWWRLTEEEVERLNPPILDIASDEEGNDYMTFLNDYQWIFAGYIPRPRTRLGWLVHDLYHGFAMRYPWHKVLGFSFNGFVTSWRSKVRNLSGAEAAVSAVFESVVQPQPIIPPGVDDLKVFQPHANSHPQIWVIQSEGEGVQRWAKERLRWGMSKEMVEESKPDSIEYYRQPCPQLFVSEGNTCELVRRDDGIWVWRVTRLLGTHPVQIAEE